METIFTVSPVVIHPYTRHHKKLKKKKKTARCVGDAVGPHALCGSRTDRRPASREQAESRNQKTLKVGAYPL